MRCTAAVALVLGVVGRGLRKSGIQDVDLTTDVDEDDEQAAGVWIPITEDQKTFFYNPVKGISVNKLPRGAVTTLAVQTDGVAEKVAHGNATEHPTLVPLDQRKSCVPHCKWECDKPVCQQDCQPLCGVPACETRCPKLGADHFKGCKVKCGEPNCAMFCPKDPCEGSKVLDCNTPKCTTRCEKPKCELDCSNANSGCQTSCAEPQCQWHCKKPKDCPKPKCKMVCEQPPECVKGQRMMVPPPLPDGWEVTGHKRKAAVEKAKWVTAAWSDCSIQCGKGIRKRKVECNSGEDSHCEALGNKPASMEICENYVGCKWVAGDWEPCSEKCGPGTREREVHCTGPKCLQDKPASSEKCYGRAETCDMCQVTMWGGKTFDGWEHTFTIGEYNSAELEFRGLKCDDVSSLEVVGDFCEMVGYEFGDFNKIHNGWEAKFTQGKYDVNEMEAHGARNNDMSSLKVYSTKKKKGGDGAVGPDGQPIDGTDGGMHPMDGGNGQGGGNLAGGAGGVNGPPGARSGAAASAVVAVLGLVVLQ
mmetsp:Transcript_32092/g.78341  ORF Transcript_32092/g.78341 Transcript_32092/m.78341 type:complete len:531 (+) Transcript_32092:97-1689(+)